MPWTSLRISPGIVRNGTRYSAAGTWYDCSLVRFRDGFPERWSGWVNAYPANADAVPPDPGLLMAGTCRSLHRHGTLLGVVWTSAGTSRKFYVVSNIAHYDVTPLDPAWPALGTVLPANPLSTTLGSKIVTVNHVAHGRLTGNYVIVSGAAAVGGIPAAEINIEQLVTGWVDDNNYQITVATTAATSTATGGGAAVNVIYILPIGADDAVSFGGGWSGGIWGHTYGWGLSAVGSFSRMGVWTQDNWGEDLVANPNGGGIYFWKATTPSVRMIDLNNIPAGYLGPGSPAAVPLHIPDAAEFILVSHRDRHLLAFGTSVYLGAGLVEPMLVRWCSQENFLNWDDADTTGTAGSLPLSNGSRFISAISTTREHLVWSDQALYSLQYVGAPLIYVADILERWSDICGLKARCSFNGIVYWMGTGGFYAYTGRVEKIPCPIWDHISTHLNREQVGKVYASSNQKHNEVIFFYPSIESVEVDSYVALDVAQQVWTMGSLARSAWMDMDTASPTLATEPGPVSSRMFQHDNGSDDGSTTPASPLNAFIEGGPIELSSEGSYDKGDKMMFVRKVMPDVTFRDIETSVSSPQMNIVLKMQNEPGSTLMDSSSSQVQRSARATAVLPIEQFTRNCHVRLRGRSLTLRAESNSLGSEWRLGITRIDARTDGQR